MNSIYFSCDDLSGMEVCNMATCIMARGGKRRLKIIPSDSSLEEMEKSYILSPDISECEDDDDDDIIVEDVFVDVAKDAPSFKEENRVKCVSHSEATDDSKELRYRCSFLWSVSSC